MKKLIKKLISFLFILTLCVTVTPRSSTSDSNPEISLYGHEDEEIDIGILTRN